MIAPAGAAYSQSHSHATFLASYRPMAAVEYRTYSSEDEIPVIVDLIAPYLSEPYSVYCYRYFLHGWPQLCILVSRYRTAHTSSEVAGLMGFNGHVPERPTTANRPLASSCASRMSIEAS